jgi:hypothetical protein
MKPGIKRTMRVATTFTGTAVCAAAFNPAAMAATSPPPHAGHQQLRAIANTGNKRLSGSIVEGGCAPEWLHIGTGAYGADCFGYRGLMDLSPWPIMHSFCGGTNSGYIWGQDNLHSYTVYDNFHPGTYFYHLPNYVKWFLVSEIAILSWRGNDRCPS